MTTHSEWHNTPIKFVFLGLQCEICQTPETGGETSIETSTSPEVHMRVCSDYNQTKMEKVLFHELFEAGLHILGCTYKSENQNNYSMWGIINHTELTMLCDAVYEAFTYIVGQLNNPTILGGTDEGDNFGEVVVDAGVASR